jgi:phosphatidate cytidylyltransferase
MIASILLITLPIFLVGAVLMAGVGGATWLKYAVYIAVVHLVLATMVAGWFWAVAGLILAAGAVELARALLKIQGDGTRVAVTMIYCIVSAGFALSATLLPREFLVLLYLVVAGFDGFSEIFGRLLGRIKLAQTISPGKTVEGALAGGAGAIVLAVAAGHIAGVTPSASAMLGIGIAVTALLGDLAASWVKRRAQIKDFSGVIPGHGGVLDRFDSFIGVDAIVGMLICAALKNSISL